MSRLEESNRPITTSHSALRNWFTCKFLHWIENVLRLEVKYENVKMEAGSAWHEALADHHRGKKRSEVLGTFRKKYQPFIEQLQEPLPPNDPYTRQNLEEIILHWLRMNPLESLPYTIHPENVEMRIEVPLDEKRGIWLLGFIDGLPELKGRWKILESKSTGRMITGPYGDQWMDKWHDDSQITSYLWAMGEMYEGVNGVLMQFVRFAKIPGAENTKRCGQHKEKYQDCRLDHIEYKLAGPYYREREDIEEWKEAAIGAAEGMVKLAKKAPRLEDMTKKEPDGTYTVPRDGRMKGACEWCGMRRLCRDGRNPDNFRVKLSPRPPRKRG